MKQGGDAPSIVFSTDSEEELKFRTVLMLVQIVKEPSFMLPIHSFQVSHPDKYYQISLRPNGNVTSLTPPPPQHPPLPPQRLLTIIPELIGGLMKAEAEYEGPMVVDGEGVFVAGEWKEVRLAQTMKRAQGEASSIGLQPILILLFAQYSSRVDSPFTSVLSELLASLRALTSTAPLQHLIAWWESSQPQRTVLLIDTLNETVRERDWDSAQSALEMMDLAKLRFVACWNDKCKGTHDGEIVSYCPDHIFCSSTCLSSLFPDKPTRSCPLCLVPPPPLVLRRLKVTAKPATPAKISVCPCGTQFSPTDNEWTIPLLGSSRYSEAITCCSEHCFTVYFPDKAWKGADEKETEGCLYCGAGRGQLNSHGFTMEMEMDCKVHFLCSMECYHVFEEKSMLGINCWPTCPYCVRHLSDLAQMRNQEYEGELQLVEEKQKQWKELQTREAIMDVMETAIEVKALILQKKKMRDPRPLYASAKKNYKIPILLACCHCRASICIDSDYISKTKQFRRGAFLIRCELKVHGVCSLACWEAIESAGENCPICPGFALDIESAHADWAVTHPTAQVLRRLHATFCNCQLSTGFFSLSRCSHEVCRECLGRILEETNYSQWYSCFFCGENYLSEDLILKLCS